MLLWKSLINAFEHDRAAARGKMNSRKLVIFKHSSHLGNELSGRLFERVTVTKKSDLPRSKDDYQIDVNKEQLPTGIDVTVWPEQAVY
jgi:CRISPR-associated protein Csd2